MPEAKKNGFLSGWQGNFAQRVGRALVQGFLPGDQRGADGTLTNVGSGIIGRGAGILGTLVGGPAVGALVSKAAGSYIDNGSFVPTGNGPLANLMGYGTQQQLGQGLANSQQSMQQQIFAKNPELAALIGNPQATVGPVERLGISQQGQMQTPNIRPTSAPISMPAVQAEQPWTGSLAGRNPFGGSYGGNLGFSAPPTHTYSGRSGFTASNPYASVLTGQAARDTVAGMRGPTLSRRLFEIY